jgi:hypothetical protein
MSCRSKTSLRFCLLAACLWLSGAPAFAQPLTTKPSTNMIVTPCAANAPVMGNGTGASPGCGPTPVRAGDLMYFNGTNWVSLAGNNSGTQILQETSAGVPSWVTVSGTGTVTSVTCFGTAITSAGTCITTGQIPGTATNDNSSAGNVGEFISSTVLVGSAVAAPVTAAFNVTSISLTAGDWDVWGSIATNPAASTLQISITGWISTASATIPTIPNGGAYAQLTTNFAVGDGQVLPVGKIRISLASTTTVFLSAFLNFNTSTNAAYGFIGARRVR